MNGNSRDIKNTCYRRQLIILYLLCNNKLAVFTKSINTFRKNLNSKTEKSINKKASKISILSSYKTIFDTDFNYKLKCDKSYLNLFYFLLISDRYELAIHKKQRQKQVFFIPSAKMNITHFYWYKCFFLICKFHNIQIIASTQWKWTNVLKAFKYLWPSLSYIEIDCQTDFGFSKPQKSFYDLRYFFPCFDKKCFNNKLFRKILLADIIIIESGVSTKMCNFIIKVCSENNKPLFYKPTYTLLDQQKRQKNTFFQKNGIKKLTLLNFLKLRWSY